MVNQDVDVRTRIGKVEVEGFLANAPGPRKDEKSWLEVAASTSPVVWMGSFCHDRRAGNEGQNYWDDPSMLGALNSLGLPSRPPEEYEPSVERVEATGKHVVIDVAGLKVAEFPWLAKFFWRPGRSICLNLGCPNLAGKKPFIFDPEAGRAAIEQTRDALPDANLIVTVSYHPDNSFHDGWAPIFVTEKVDALRVINTLGNARARYPETGRLVIEPNEGLAGLSGDKIRELAQGQIYLWHKLLPEIGLIATGGISRGWHLIHHMMEGADFGLSATDYGRKGVSSLDRVQLEVVEYMEKLEMYSIRDIHQRGREG